MINSSLHGLFSVMGFWFVGPTICNTIHGYQTKVWKARMNRVKDQSRGNISGGWGTALQEFGRLFQWLFRMELRSTAVAVHETAGLLLGMSSQASHRRNHARGCYRFSLCLIRHKPELLQKSVAVIHQKKSRQDRAPNEPRSQTRHSYRGIYSAAKNLLYTVIQRSRFTVSWL